MHYLCTSDRFLGVDVLAKDLRKSKFLKRKEKKTKEMKKNNISGSEQIKSNAFIVPNTIVIQVEEFEAAQLMVRLRSVASQSPLPVFVFHTQFVFYEQYVTVKDSILKNIGVTAVGQCSWLMILSMFCHHVLAYVSSVGFQHDMLYVVTH